MDYTPQAIYWLGGELSQNKEFEWTDGSAMTFQVFPTYSLLDFGFTNLAICDRAGCQAKALSKSYQLSTFVWAYNGKSHQRQCYHLVSIGHRKNVPSSVATSVKRRNKRKAKRMCKIKRYPAQKDA